ncbi:hypothetical protein CKY51_15025 [Xanthomonas maliensis]|nr:hypothetical protein CKY51_15025 [Xanthomonas maliensis]
MGGLDRRDKVYICTPIGRSKRDRLAEPLILRLAALNHQKSAEVTLHKELLARLRLCKGDELSALETSDCIELTAFDPPRPRKWSWTQRHARHGCAPICTCGTSRASPYRRLPAADTPQPMRHGCRLHRRAQQRLPCQA